MARKHLLLGITAGTGLAAALVIPAQANAVPPAERTHTAATAPRPAPRPAPSDRAAEIQKRLRMSLGARFAGAWLTGGSHLVVATTDTSATSAIKAAGARPVVVEHGEKTLQGVQEGLNRNARSAAKSVTAWYVEPQSNVVIVRSSNRTAAERFVKASGVDAHAVRIVHSTAKPRPLHDLVGGEPFHTAGSGCSIGFAVQGGFITAGHCGNKDDDTAGDNRDPQGMFGGSSFPGNDYAWVDTNSRWTPTPKVNKWDGTFETVHGATPAPVGTEVCRSGSTTNTQLWCGTIKELNATANYDQGVVTGLIRADICGDFGDSGGPLITRSGGQAQGILSGGEGFCSDDVDPDETFYQPVGEVLQLLARQGRHLVTEGGGPGPSACGEYDTKLTGSLKSGSSTYRPSSYTTKVSGAHTACLDGPDGVDFDLYLQKLHGSTWQTVAKSTSPTPDETITYNGAPGTYRYRVHVYRGSGEYTFGFSRP